MVEARIKSKRKTKSDLKNEFAALFQPVPIDFIAYLPLEECAVRLENCKEPGWWGFSHTTVTITPVDDTTYDFTIKREQSKEGNVEAHGCLQDYEGKGTYVTGEVITPPKASGSIAVFVGMMMLVLIFHSNLSLLVFVAMPIVIIAVDVFAQMHHRHELAEMIETTLGY